MKILLVGGSKSGKSMTAQRLARALSGGAPMYYWATMEPTDGEDLARIERHRQERAGWGFATVERARALPAALPELDVRGTALFDSVTACLAAEMFPPEGAPDADAAQRTISEILAVSEHFANFVCVCDAVWSDGAVYDEWTERYRRGLAMVCRALAGQFDVVAEITAGLPVIWKGKNLYETIA